MTKRRDVILGLTGVAVLVAGSGRAAEPGEHRLAIQVSDDRPESMTLALSNAVNVSAYYSERAQEVQVEIVTYGPGVHMLRTDTSPIKERMATFPKSMPNVVFVACGNTLRAMEKTEGKPVPLISEAKVMQAGVVRLMELQEMGWSYVKV